MITSAPTAYFCSGSQGSGEAQGGICEKMQGFKTVGGLNCRERVQAFVVDEPGHVESVWKDLKELEKAVEVWGITKGIARHKVSWWWNGEVAALVEKNQYFFKLWKGSKKCLKSTSSSSSRGYYLWLSPSIKSYYWIDKYEGMNPGNNASGQAKNFGFEWHGQGCRM